MTMRRRDGFSMLELMVATSIMLVVFVSAFPLVDQMMGRFQMARDHYVAATICQARIERARAVPYSNIPLYAETKALVDDFGNLSSPNGRFRRTTSVATNAPSSGLTQMTVQTEICICSRWGWRSHLHPLPNCAFTDEKESMKFVFTEYNK